MHNDKIAKVIGEVSNGSIVNVACNNCGIEGLDITHVHWDCDGYARCPDCGSCEIEEVS